MRNSCAMRGLSKPRYIVSLIIQSFIPIWTHFVLLQPQTLVSFYLRFSMTNHMKVVDNSEEKGKCSVSLYIDFENTFLHFYYPLRCWSVEVCFGWVLATFHSYKESKKEKYSFPIQKNWSSFRLDRKHHPFTPSILQPPPCFTEWGKLFKAAVQCQSSSELTLPPVLWVP